MNRPLALAFVLTACAHTQPAEMTASEHRAEAARHLAAAEAMEKRATSDPGPFFAAPPRSPFGDEAPTLRPYNPTKARLDEADRQLRSAYEHLQAAQKLERFEAEACTGVPMPERAACPVLAPHLEWVEELGEGLALHLKATAPAGRLADQLQCHLAFAQANGFDKAPCPLFVKGVRIETAPSVISFRSADPKVAAEVRAEGRKLFGPPEGTTR